MGNSNKVPPNANKVPEDEVIEEVDQDDKKDKKDK